MADDRVLAEHEETEEEMAARIRAMVEAEFGRLDQVTAAQERTRVDVSGGGEDDSQLDDHLWVRLAARCESEAEVRALPDDLRAYYVTRLFEWSILHDGADAFFTFSPELSDLVAPAYRHLHLEHAARAYEAFRASEPAQRLLADTDYEPTDEEHADLNALWDAIGEHDADRIAFVRARPRAFSI